MKTLLRLAARNTLRRKARSLLTAGMVMVSVALLVLAMTLLRGIFGQMLVSGVAAAGEVRVVAPAYAQREELAPLAANLPEVQPLAADLEREKGVRSAEPRLSAGVVVTRGEVGDVFALAVGAHERFFRERLHAQDKLVAGAWFSGASDELVAGKWLVDQLHAKVGDPLVVLGTTKGKVPSTLQGRLVGVVHGEGLEQQLLLPLERMQALTDLPGAATELLVYGDDFHDAGALAAALRRRPSLAALTVQAWSEREPWGVVSAMLNGVQGIIALILGLLTALGIWNTMSMTVLERTSELGVLRAMGMSRARVVGLVVIEAVTLAAVGGALGLLLGAGPAWLLSTRGLHLGARTAEDMAVSVSETLHGQFSASTLLTAFGLGVLMAVVGSVVPALRAASVQPVAAMRTGR